MKSICLAIFPDLYVNVNSIADDILLPEKISLDMSCKLSGKQNLNGAFRVYTLNSSRCNTKPS